MAVGKLGPASFKIKTYALLLIIMVFFIMITVGSSAVFNFIKSNPIMLIIIVLGLALIRRKE